MKKILFYVMAIAITLGLSTCGGRCSHHDHDHENCTEHDHDHDHNHKTHTHADGTVHSDHAPEQESFTVEADSTSK